MDPEKEERIRKERERIRIASQKTRLKKRLEEQTLRHENEQMKRERVTLLSTLEELEQTLARLQEQLADKSESRSENEKLSRELQYYKEFGAACALIGQEFDLQETQISDSLVRKRLLEQMTKSGGEMAYLQAERILSDAMIANSHWHNLDLDAHVKQLSSCVRGRYRIIEDGSGEWQFHICIPTSTYEAKFFAEKYTALWHDPRALISIFSQSGGWSRNIIESKVEQLTSVGDTRLQRIRIQSEQSWMFVLTEQNGVPFARSLLVPSSPVLVPPIALEDYNVTFGNNRDAYKRGLVDCWMGTRASIMLDSSLEMRENCVKGKFFEAFRIWNDELASKEPTAPPIKCVKAILAVSASRDFAIETFGEQGFAAVFDMTSHKVAPAYRNFINFLASYVGIDRIPLPNQFG